MPDKHISIFGLIKTLTDRGYIYPSWNKIRSADRIIAFCMMDEGYEALKRQRPPLPVVPPRSISEVAPEPMTGSTVLAPEPVRLYDVEQIRARLRQTFLAPIVTDQLVIKPFRTVKDVMLVGEDLNICIFENNYFRKENTILFQAILDKQTIEVAEFDLRSRTVVQCHGLDHTKTAYHSEIIKLINEKSKEIIKTFKKKAA
jgi:hypothetical protein